MLEKMGLPAKPSLRGNTWVVDASHCQSCSSQFTFLNRKHHCRRCGGIFCNTCTQHRMVLRGQGDSPVRICEPCKKLEEAARFELRYGHKNRAAKGSSKPASQSVDEVLNQILTNDGKESSKDGASVDKDTSLLGTASSNDNFGADNNEMDSVTPEELRQQALDERKQHKILKADGKSAEALKAFKKAKELERQAAALELQLRKNRRKALASASSSTTEAPTEEEVPPETITRDKSLPRKGKEKDDLTAELRQLGWSDMDIHDVDKKPATMSLEGELLNLIGHNSGKPSHSKESSGLDKSQVIALKKKALTLKREGKLAEAKEELKRAKILEKQIEEQEFLAEADESDDELSALMRSVDNDDRKGFSTGFDLDVGFDMNNLSDFGGDLGLGGNFEVTDDDFHDPEMAATLQSLGWDEDSVQLDDDVPESASVNRKALEEDILKLKREAVSEKRAGNMAEAMSLLKKAKKLEKDLETLDDANMTTDSELGELGAATSISKTERKPAAKSKLTIQRELLALKKTALALRREGKLEEADNELKKGKVLEQQLEEMENASNVRTQMNVSYKASEPIGMDLDLTSVFAPVEEDDVDLTDQDVNDPTYLSVLQNLGWQDGDDIMPSSQVSIPSSGASTENKDKTSATVTVPKRRRSKAEIQRELLGLKRKALALRRQGQETEAEELLSTAKMLEEELSESEAPKQAHVLDSSETIMTVPEVSEPIEKETHQTPLKRAAAEAIDASEKRQVVHAAVPETDVLTSVSPDNPKSPVQLEILSHKRKALLLKREGKLAEARDELRKAKLLERNLQDDKPENPAGPVTMEVTYSTVASTVKDEHSPSNLTVPDQKGPSHSTTKPMSSNDRFKLQRECLNHKRNALKLRREGKTDEADAELELAKKLESQLEEASPQNPAPATSAGGSADVAGIEDLFDSQLLSALQAIGLQDAPVVSNATAKQEASSSNNAKNNVSSEERVQMEAQIKAEKVKALNLKRAGKQAEALDVLRRAKQMEKKLNTLPL
ncbi:hypothetical protein RND81_07G136000 [Saponaria officinalis]|uniref:FYVE-type domain-containing protein n=1 Tax=Saponaria officinalis TaxID=3572 RepID=A0AAW1JTR4_SAPOF